MPPTFYWYLKTSSETKRLHVTCVLEFPWFKVKSKKKIGKDGVKQYQNALTRGTHKIPTSNHYILMGKVEEQDNIVQ